MSDAVEEADCALLVRLSSGQFITIPALDNELIWHVKIKLSKVLFIQPEKQMLFLLGESKELENLARLLEFPELKIMRGEKRLVILKEKEDIPKKIKKKSLTLTRLKKPRDFLSPIFTYASGRGLTKGILNFVSKFQIHVTAKDLQPFLAKEILKNFNVNIHHKVSNHNVANIKFEVTEHESIIKVSWVPLLVGDYFVSIQTQEGDHIFESPFTTIIVDHENSGEVIKKMAADSEFNVEAARVLSEWSSKEEYNNVLLKDVGVNCILSLSKTEPSFLIKPILVDIFSRLIEKDAFIIAILEGGIENLLIFVELYKSIKNVTISQFVSKSFSLVGHYVASAIASMEENKEMVPTTGIFKHIDISFFEVIEEMFKTNEDVETLRNLTRSVASFSGCQFYSSMIANLLPYITNLFENIDTEISTRRYALITISNLTSFMEISKIKFNLITESTVQKLISCVDIPLTGDQLVTDSLKALANLCDYPQFSILISSHPFIERIIKSISETDCLLNWEIVIPVGMIDQTSSDISKIFVKYNTIRSLVRFMNSANRNLQEIAINIIAILSKFNECRGEIMRSGGLESLCLALNTCRDGATAAIIAALAQMPLNAKSILVNIIGDQGVIKLVEYYRHSDDNELRKHTAILLASLVGNDGTYDVIKQGGSELVRSLIDLIKNRTVNVQTFIPPSELVFKGIIGEGICGVVWEAIWKDEINVAVKKFNEESISFSEEEFQSEVALMSVLRHENISHCLGSWTGEENYYIVLELFERGSLANIISDYHHQDLSIQMIIHLSLGASKGMNYLHRLGIIHRDLKTGNLLVTSDWQVKVADFGLSRVSDKLMTRGVGTPIYTAPEVLAGSSYSLKADIYSFAYVLWEMVTRQVPFADIPPFEAVHLAATENLRPEIPPDCLLADLIGRCWSPVPDERPDFEEIIKILTELQSAAGSLHELSSNSLFENEKERKNRRQQTLRDLQVKEEKRRKDRILRPNSMIGRSLSNESRDQFGHILHSFNINNHNHNHNHNINHNNSPLSPRINFEDDDDDEEDDKDKLS